MRTLEDHLNRVSGSLVLVMICLFGFGNEIGTAPVTSGRVAAAVIFLAAFSAFCGMRPTGKLLMCVFVAGCIFAAFAVAGRTASAGFVRGYLSWLSGSASELPAGSGIYPYIQVAVVSIGCFVFQLLGIRLYWLERIAAGAMLAGLLAAMLTGWEISRPCVMFVLLYVSIVYVRWTRQGWDKRKNSASRPFAVWILPFLCVYLLLMTIMPAPDQPYSWSIVRRVYHNLREAIVTISQNYFSGDGEDFGSLGFSDSGKLADGVQSDDEVLMTLTVKNCRSGNIYLSGKVYDQFTGRQWQQTDPELEDDRMMDTLETICSVYGYDRNNLSAYLSGAEVDIVYQYFHTRYMFAPLKTWKIAGADNKKRYAYRQANGDIVFSKRQSYGTRYTVNCFQMNAGHEAFDRFLEAGRGADAQIWQLVQREYRGAGAERIELEDLERYQDRIHEIYGSSPALSERTRSWLDEVAGEGATDLKKLRAIEAALSDYSYTRMPGAIPEEVDTEEEYLDFFLLESRKGFCSYFATAFVLLARAEGIPARYVEGFCVPVGKQGETSVYSYMAHSWPEVYLDGVGWIPFEPTPGYGSLRYTSWKTVFDQSGQMPEYDVDAWREWLASRNEQPEEVPDAPEEVPEKVSSGVWKIVGCALLVNLVLLISVLRLISLIRARLRAGWEVDRRFAADVQRNIQILTLLGFRRQPWETLETLDKRVCQELEKETGAECRLRFLHLYEEVLYGGRTVDERMYAAVQKEGHRLEELLREREPRRYLYYRLVQLFL